MKKLLILTAVLTLAVETANAQWSTNGSNVYYNGGNVGIGTAIPASLLHLAGAGGVNALTFDTPGAQRFRFGSVPGVINWGALSLNARYSSGWHLDDTATNGWFFKIDTRGGNVAHQNNGLWLFRVPNGANPHTNETAVFGVTNGRTFFSGQVGIGNPDPDATPDAQLQVTGTMHVTGSVTVDGNISAKYQDLAEWVTAIGPMRAGTVVVVEPEADDAVVASNAAYQTSVAGVVSDKPGLLLGTAADSKVKVATTGRVRVWADASFGPIHRGDLLVTSTEPGMAMRSEPFMLAGVRVHRPGTLIGKALEPLESGQKDILVLLSLQ